MADPTVIAGAKIFTASASIATQAADFVEGDFSGVTWVEVDGWTQMGELGDNNQIVRTELINRGRDFKQKGTADGGSMQNTFINIPGDAGQTIVKTQRNTRANYPWKVELDDDNPDVAGTSVTTFYFVGLTMSWQVPGGGANTEILRNATVEVNSNVVEVEAAQS